MAVFARGQITFVYAGYGMDKQSVRTQWIQINGIESLTQQGTKGSYYTTRQYVLEHSDIVSPIVLEFNGEHISYNGFVLRYRGLRLIELEIAYNALRTFLIEAGLNDGKDEFVSFDWDTYADLVTEYYDAERHLIEFTDAILRSDVEYLKRAFADGSSIIEGGLILSEFIGVYNSLENVVAAMNGSTTLPGWQHQTHGSIMIAAGISSLGSSSVEAAASTKIYADGTIITNLLFASGGTIGGWTLGETRLSSGTGSTYVALDSGTQNVNYAIWAGAASPISAPFFVTRAGHLYANDATISGTITASGGNIGGWEVGATTLHSGTGSNSVYFDSGTTGVTYAIWAGAEAPASAPFSVTRNGTVTALLGHIGGWTVGATRLSSGVTTNYVALDSGTSGVNHFIWSGAELPANAPFSVTKAGYLYATNAHIEGYIYADSGTIGGWSIGEDTLYTQDLPYVMYMNSDIATGDDINYIGIYRINPGQQVKNYRFYVTRDGDMFAGDISANNVTTNSVNWGTATNGISADVHLVLLTSAGTYSLPDSDAEIGCELEIVVIPQSSGGIIPIIYISSTGTIDFVSNNTVTSGSSVTVLTGTYKAIYWGSSYWTLSKIA